MNLVPPLAYAVVGIGIGVLWYRHRPRPFGERMRETGRVLLGLALVFVVLGLALELISLFTADPDDGVTVNTRGFAWPSPMFFGFVSVPLGLFLAERRTARGSVRPPA